jgi:hypothetical protein
VMTPTAAMRTFSRSLPAPHRPPALSERGRAALQRLHEARSARL